MRKRERVDGGATAADDAQSTTTDAPPAGTRRIAALGSHIGGRGKRSFCFGSTQSASTAVSTGSSTGAANVPAVDEALLALNREVLTVLHWGTLRQEFFVQFMAQFQGASSSRPSTANKNTSTISPLLSFTDQIKEPTKFKRHCREALAKWALSQKAREPLESDPASIYFLPTVGCETYDEQLVRDLSLKCKHHHKEEGGGGSGPSPSGREPAALIASVVELEERRDRAIAQFVKGFGLGARCKRLASLAEESVCSMRNGKAPLLVEGAAVSCSSVATAGNRTCTPGGGGGSTSTAGTGAKTTAVGGPVEGEQRIKGDTVKVALHFRAGSTLPPWCMYMLANIETPLPVWRKLQRTYRWVQVEPSSTAHHQHQQQAPPYRQRVERDSIPLNDVALATQFTLRAATLLLRYEVNLASGSLQLCADESLKQLLVSKGGFRVADLCASPINAFVEAPRTREGVETKASSSSEGKLSSVSLAPADENVKHSPSCDDDDAVGDLTTVGGVGCSSVYCSAFFDTDRHFGSLGSALRLDLDKFINEFCCCSPTQSSSSLPVSTSEPSSAGCVKEAARLQQHWVLTLDVPYDEDLCELLFLKLGNDLRRLSSSSSSVPHQCLHFFGVLPLWWNLQFPCCTKEYIHEEREGGGEETTTSVTATATASLTTEAEEEKKKKEEDEKKMRQLIEEGASYLKLGHQIPYRWIKALPAAVTVDTDAESPSDLSTGSSKPRSDTGSWVSYNAVFVKDSYTYYCTSTNRMLCGVTATELIAFDDPTITSSTSGSSSPCGEGVAAAATPPSSLLLGVFLRDFYHRKKDN